MTDLHTEILTRLAGFREAAETAARSSPPNWHASGSMVRGRDETRHWPIANAGLTGDTTEISTHIATWHPDQALRWLEWAEDVARRHKPVDTIDGLEGGPWCAGCSIVDYESGDVATVPFERCADYRGLARALDIEVSG